MVRLTKRGEDHHLRSLAEVGPPADGLWFECPMDVFAHILATEEAGSETGITAQHMAIRERVHELANAKK